MAVCFACVSRASRAHWRRHVGAAGGVAAPADEPSFDAWWGRAPVRAHDRRRHGGATARRRRGTSRGHVAHRRARSSGCTLEPRRDRFVRPRSLAGRRRRPAHLRPPPRPGPLEPRDGHRPRRRLRGRQRHRSALRELPRRAGGRPGRVDGRRHRPGRARHAGRALSRRRRRTATGCSRPTWRTIPNGQAKQAGILLGRAVAAAHPAARCATTARTTPSRSTASTTSPATGPASGGRIRSACCRSRSARAGAAVRPFVLPSGRAFRAPPPPALWSAAYAAAYNEVKRLGGDGVITPTARTDDQTMAGIYWAYDGTPSLCAPPRLYNQIAEVIATRMGSDVAEQARLFALVNVAMADAGIAIWESKFFYKLWRPVTGIREADPGTGPTGIGDRNPLTARRPDLHAARRAGQQPRRAELHAAVPGLSVGPRRLRRRAVPDPAQRSTAATTSRSRSSPTS